MRFPHRSTVRAAALLALWALVTLGALAGRPAAAEIPEPDHTFYGGASLDGVAAATGTVTLTVGGEAEPVATYELGSDDDLDACKPGTAVCYALRVPMDFGLPRRPGTAQEGDRASLFLDGQLAAQAVIGAAGAVQLLDLDTDFVPLVPTLSIADAAGAESLAGPFGQDVTVTLLLSFPSIHPVTVAWQTADGTATAGSDYAAASGVATFAPGETLATLSVTIFDDAVPEADPAMAIAGESFSIQLSSPTEAGMLDAAGAVTIIDDDTRPALAISNLSVVEPPADAVEAAFTVSLSHVWDQDVTFDYSGVAGTAGSSDFELAAGSATIPAGSLTAEIAVTILADGEAEDDETFEVRLANPVAASLRPGGGQGTILESGRFLTFVERQRDGEAGADGLFGAIDVALSPGGEHLYAAGRGEDALAVFERDAATGRLAFVTAYRDGEGGLENLGGIEAVAVSPDGERLYAAAFDDGALAVFERDAADGTLTLIEVERQGGRDLESGDTIEGLAGAIALAVAEDPAGGEHVYVAGSEGDAVAVFRRDAASGLVSFEEVQRDADPQVDGLDRAVALAVAPDGAQLYVASLEDDSVAVFDRDAVTGLLTFVEAHFDGDPGGVDGLAGAAAVAVAPDGASVYAAGQADGGLAVFDRAPDGRLTFRQAVLSGAGGVSGLALATDVAVSRDGFYVFASGFADDSVAVFERAADGSLTFLEVELDGEAGVDGLNGATALAVSDDDGEVYVSGTLDDAVAVFRRDLVAPAGPDVLVSTSHVPGVLSRETVIDLEWSGARDDETGSGVAGYWLLLDGAPDTVPDTGAPSVFVAHGLDDHTAASAPQPDGERWVHLLTCDHAGNCALTHAGPFVIDATDPGGLVAASTSHTPGLWSNDPTIDVGWSEAMDPAALRAAAKTGVAGYSFAFTNDPASQPDAVIDLPHTQDPHATTSAPLADGDSHYFHLRVCDTAGNCAPAVHLGPFWIDTTAPDAVTGLTSLSHAAGVPSARTELTIAWDAAADATSGVDGFGVELSQQPAWTCDQVRDVGESTTQFTSPPLADGTWYAHVCAVDRAGNASAVATTGPFEVAGAAAAANRLLNPEFHQDLSFWLRIDTLPNEIVWHGDDVHAVPTSGSAQLTPLASANQDLAIAQCVSFPAETRYELTGQVRLAVTGFPDPVAFATVEFFSSADCTASPLDAELSTVVTGDTAGQWPLLELEGRSPPGAVSALVTFTVQAWPSSLFTGSYDHLFFGVEALIFSDGFESGDVSAWSRSSP